MSKDDGESGFRVGGAPPTGVSPAFVDETTCYFGTFELNDESELSLFFSVDPNQREPRSITKNKYIFHDETQTLVQFVVHEPAKRSAESSLTAPFDGHTLMLGAERMDPESAGDLENVWAHHKAGGTPFYYVLYEDLLAESAQLLNNGWIHLVQLSSLGFEDAPVEGDWPIWKWMFHVFAKPEGDGLEFRYIWA